MPDWHRSLRVIALLVTRAPGTGSHCTTDAASLREALRLLAAERPDKLRELQARWFEEARKYNVLPLDDRRYERTADPTRPVAAIEKPSYDYYPDTSILHPLAAPQLLGREHTITAYVTIPEGGAEGVLACSGGEFGGWSLFIRDGRLRYTHNYLKIKDFEVTSAKEVPTGKRRLSVRFTPKSKSVKPDLFTGDVSLFIDGEKVGEIKDIKTAGQYSAITGYGLLIGRNTGTPVSHSYEPPFSFTGTIEKVTVDRRDGPRGAERRSTTAVG